MSKVYGYCRCSTDENKQDISRQVRELKEMGAVPETIFTEYISGMKENKVELQKLLNVIRSGDTLAVYIFFHRKVHVCFRLFLRCIRLHNYTHQNLHEADPFFLFYLYLQVRQGKHTTHNHHLILL